MLPSKRNPRMHNVCQRFALRRLGRLGKQGGLAHVARPFLGAASAYGAARPFFRRAANPPRPPWQLRPESTIRTGFTTSASALSHCQPVQAVKLEGGRESIPGRLARLTLASLSPWGGQSSSSPSYPNATGGKGQMSAVRAPSSRFHASGPRLPGLPAGQRLPRPTRPSLRAKIGVFCRQITAAERPSRRHVLTSCKILAISAGRN
jgi:hypothetical protein